MAMALPSLLRDINSTDFNVIQRAWNALGAVPGGKAAFSRLVGLAAPYTGTIKAQVLELERGRSVVMLRDRRGVRNHLQSVHAVALANLIELTGNVALAYSLPNDARFIVKAMNIEYLKKARGTLTARCNCPVPENSARQELEVIVEVFDRSGDVVTRGTLISLVGPKRD